MAKIKKVLAFVLTVLMVVGVLPMSVFAWTVPENAAPTDEYRINNSIEDLLNGAYKSEAKYWTAIYKSAGISSLYGNTARKKHSYSYNSSYLEMDPTAAGTLPVTQTGDVISLPQDTSKTAAEWGKGAKGGSPWLVNAGVRHNGAGIKNTLWAKNMAGIDTAVTFQIKPNTASGVGSAGIFTGVQGNQNDADQGFPCILSIHHDENGVFTLKLGTSGNALATLDTENYNTISIVYDVGGDTRAEAVANYYVYVEGNYVGCGAFATKDQLNSLYAAQIANNEAGGTNYHNGQSFQYISFQSTTVFYDLTNIAAYYYDDTPDDRDISNAKRGGAIPNIIYHNDFNALAVDSVLVGDGATASGYRGTTVAGSISVYDKGDNKSNDFKVVANSAGDNAIELTATGESYIDISLGSAGSVYSANSGKSFFMQFDIKANGFSYAGPLFNFGDRGNKNSGGYETCIVPIFRDADGSLYLGYFDGSVGYRHYKSATDTIQNYSHGFPNKLPAAQKHTYLGKVTGDKYTNVAVEINVAENWFTVYIDGIDKTGELTLFNEESLETIKNSGFANGYAVTESRILYGGFRGKTVYLDNVLAYFGNANVCNVIDSTLVENHIAPNATQINALYAGDSSFAMRYYNDFNAATIGATNKNVPAAQASTNITPSINAGITWVDDGNGGAAAKWRATAKNTYLNFQTKTTGDRMGTLDSGKSFVFSMDVKGGDTYAETPLVAFSAHTFFVEAVQGLNHANYCPIYVGSDGLYLGYDGTAMINTKDKLSAAGVKKAENKILTLSKDEFVNIAVAVNVPNNTWSLYVDGVCVRQDLTFINPEHLGENNSNVNTAYANGFGLAYARIHQNESNAYMSKDGITIDNVAIYNADSFKATASTLYATYDIYEADTNSGYNYEKGNIFYYENGVKVSNKVSGDGMLTIDENGQVFYGETAVSNMADYYTVLANGEIVPVDGKYTGSVYCANSILGDYTGNIYYYENGNRVVSRDCYAIDGTPYVIDADGFKHPYTGIYNNKYYVDGLAQINGPQYVGEDVYYAGADGTFQSGVYEINGEDWVFDATTFKGEKVVIEEGNGIIIDTNTGVKYKSIEDAIDQIEEDGELKLYGNMQTNSAIIIDKNITVDLNGNTIKANHIDITSGTNIVVSANNKGYFDVPEGEFKVARITQNILSYYEEGKGYTFATAKKQEKSEVPAPESEEIDGFTLTFRPSLDLDTEYNQKIFANGNSGVRFEVHLRTSDGTTIKAFVVEDETLVQRVYNGKNAFKLTVRGASVKYSGQELHVVYVLNSDTGVQCEIASDVKFTPKTLTE